MTICIEVGAVNTAEALHAILAERLGFPDYYFGNWDAFDECIRDYPPNETIEFLGFGALAGTLPREAELLKRCLSGYQSETPGMEYRLS